MAAPTESVAQLQPQPQPLLLPQPQPLPQPPLQPPQPKSRMMIMSTQMQPLLLFPQNIEQNPFSVPELLPSAGHGVC